MGFRLKNTKHGLVENYHGHLAGKPCHVRVVAVEHGTFRMRDQEKYTHFGVVISGSAVISYSSIPPREIHAGEYFCIRDDSFSLSVEFPTSKCLVFSIKGYDGMNSVGGPLQSYARYKYLGGGFNSVLVHPVKAGDPALHHLLMPANTDQSKDILPNGKESGFHTHPSLRVGIILSGSGECVVPGLAPVKLSKGKVFIIPTNCKHYFRTSLEDLHIIVFHPDSESGMTDENNLMRGNTFVGGLSAKHIPVRK